MHAVLSPFVRGVPVRSTHPVFSFFVSLTLEGIIFIGQPALVDPGSVVGRTGQGGGLHQRHAALGRVQCGIHRLLFVREVHAGLQFMPDAPRGELPVLERLRRPRELQLQRQASIADERIQVSGRH